jgi:hypothetical protein
MPIIQPGNGTVSINIVATERIRGVIKLDLKIVRKVSGINLPVNCYIVQGESVGSWLVVDYDLINTLCFYLTVHIRIYVL